MVSADMNPDVLRLSDIDRVALEQMLKGFGLSMVHVQLMQPIPGSHWGDEEAGLIKNSLYVRPDTPVHSALHEACHWLLMDEQRRVSLHTDAGGTAVEENAVCYLQIVLSEFVLGMGKVKMCQDMDSWGYSFRLGSAAKWFAEDAQDAIDFLVNRGYGRYVEDATMW